MYTINRHDAFRSAIERAGSLKAWVENKEGEQAFVTLEEAVMGLMKLLQADREKYPKKEDQFRNLIEIVTFLTPEQLDQTKNTYVLMVDLKTRFIIYNITRRITN